jgi:hypothetical protein
MIPIIDIAARHEQLYPRSCVAWSLELLLKVHGFQLSQNHSGYGFGCAEIEELERRGIRAVSQQNPSDFGGLERLIEDNLTKDTCTVFTMPSLLYLNIETSAVEVDCHAFTADRLAGHLTYLTWSIEKGSMVKIEREKMAKAHHVWRVLSENYNALKGLLLNTLSASPIFPFAPPKSHLES